MLKNYPFSQIRGKLTASQKTLVVLPANPSFDMVASALALRLAIIESGKNALVYCPLQMTVEYNHLVGVDQISQILQGTDMIVTLSYPVDQIERVSYNDDNGQPNVVIQPKSGAPQLSENLANFHFAGVGADLVFTIGVSDLSVLGDRNGFQGATIVNVNYENQAIDQGVIGIVDPLASTLSEMVLGLISGLGLPVGVDTAQNLLDGLWQGTNGLVSMNTGADTYEAVSICLKAGAIKPAQSTTTSPQPSRENLVKTRNSGTSLPVKPSILSDPIPPVSPNQPAKNPPADWLQPKIYRGTSTV